MSKRSYPCTIIFVAVTGEEQGLYGARHLAKWLKLKNGILLQCLIMI
jgi:Zn-dependent M28 family amino/carboxypeptidase